MASGKKTGGRKKGALNKRTSEIKEFAQMFGRAAIKRLAELGGLLPGTPAVSEAAQVSALGMVLDRAYGKPAQAMDHSISGDLMLEMLVKNSIDRASTANIEKNGKRVAAIAQPASSNDVTVIARDGWRNGGHG